MATASLNDALIKAMESKIPDGTRLANVLMEIYSSGKKLFIEDYAGKCPLH